MKKQKRVDIIRQCVSPRKMCRVFMKYDPNYYYYFPIAVNERFFLGVEEGDFILDGYTIRRIRDVKKAEIKDDICLEINRREGNLDKIVVPDIDITDWKSIFTDLKKLNKNIIVQHESLKDDSQFTIGRIVDVHATCVYVRHFDGDGIWQDRPWKISYATITTVKFETRYIDGFSKYISEPPTIQEDDR